MRLIYAAIRTGARFWPGAASLWTRGSVRGLIGSLAFALLLNAALISTFRPGNEPEASFQLSSTSLVDFPASAPVVLWALVIASSVFSLRMSASAGSPLVVEEAEQGEPAEFSGSDRGVDGTETPHKREAAGLLKSAQREYLRGHWFEAERILSRQNVLESEDGAALLLLAVIMRRSRRLDEAEGVLQRIERVRGAELWRWDVERERGRLAKQRELAKRDLAPQVSDGSDVSQGVEPAERSGEPDGIEGMDDEQRRRKAA